MEKGIYLALSGMVLKQLQLDAISDDLANANTPGFKKEGLSFKDYLVDGSATGNEARERAMATLSSDKTDFSEGEVYRTSNSLDLCIEGPGLIALEGNRYTRRGDLKLTADGFLTTANGIKVLGEKGPIKFPKVKGPIKIDPEGNIYVNGNRVNSLKLVDFPDGAAFTRMGSGVFYYKGAVVKSKAGVKQGYLEGANVDVVKEMVRLVDDLREYESYQKTVQTFDEATGTMLNNMASI